MEEDVSFTDFDKICRICLKLAKPFVPVTSFSIIDKLRECASVQIHPDDPLPKQICEICFQQLQNAHELKQLAEITDVKLRQILETKFDVESKSFEDEQFEAIDDVVKCDKDILHEIKKEINAKESCDKCDKIFSNPVHLKTHKRKAHKLLKLIEACYICGLEIKVKDLLKHCFDVHGTDQPYVCNECTKHFKTRTALQLHIRNFHKRSETARVPCDICGKRILKGEIKRHIYTHRKDRDTIQCSQCDKKFLHQCSLKLHFQRFHENKSREYKHLCTVCGKKFGTKNDLQRHGSVHRSDRPFDCSQCGKGFKLSHNLKTHIKLIHQGLKVYNRIPCKLCNKLISKTNMKPHLDTHKEVRDVFSCTQCSKQFLHQISLDQHVQKMHEKIARELRHLCNVCGKGFSTRTELKIHMLSHSDEKTFTCLTCGMKYKTMHGLRYHNKSVHLNLKPYPCPVCMRHFSTRGVVDRHMRTHTGERPFSCALCQKAFNQKSTLTTHMRLVHSV